MRGVTEADCDEIRAELVAMEKDLRHLSADARSITAAILLLTREVTRCASILRAINLGVEELS